MLLGIEGAFELAGERRTGVLATFSCERSRVGHDERRLEGSEEVLLLFVVAFCAQSRSKQSQILGGVFEVRIGDYETLEQLPLGIESIRSHSFNSLGNQHLSVRIGD